MTYFNEELKMSAKSTRDKVAEDMLRLLENILESFKGQVFFNISWYNLEFWTDDKDFGVDEFKQFSHHFEEPLL